VIDGMFAERFPAVHWADLPLPVFRSRLRYLCLMPGLPVVQVNPPQADGAARKKIIYIDRSGPASANPVNPSNAELTVRT
jgi:hypothetical protein